MSPIVRIVALVVTWALWVLPFFRRRLKGTETAVKMDPRARWGILLQIAGTFLAYMHRPVTWAEPLEIWRFVIAMLIAVPSILLVWVAVGNLGKQWRIQAGLNADHELVTDGAYRIVRHPIYASMFGMFLNVLALAGTLPGAPIGIVLFVIGIEIRVRVEDGLLRERFGDRFTAWQRSVPAWIPFVR